MKFPKTISTRKKWPELPQLPRKRKLPIPKPCLRWKVTKQQPKRFSYIFGLIDLIDLMDILFCFRVMEPSQMVILFDCISYPIPFLLLLKASHLLLRPSKLSLEASRLPLTILHIHIKESKKSFLHCAMGFGHLKDQVFFSHPNFFNSFRGEKSH